LGGCPILENVKRSDLRVVVPEDAVGSVEDGFSVVVNIGLRVEKLRSFGLCGEAANADL
jgi:hypothetical protein